SEEVARRLLALGVDDVAEDGEVVLRFAEVNFLEVAGQIVEAFGEAVALDVLARGGEDAGEVLRGDARLPVGLREGDAPDAGAARYVEHAQALRVAARADRRGGSTRGLAVDGWERPR